MDRRATIERNTKETNVSVTLNLDGSGTAQLDTGIGFFDHMLDGFARHGFFDLAISADGDLEVDCHHTIEDTGIVLGKAIKEAVGDKKGIRLHLDYSFYAAGMLMSEYRLTVSGRFI